MDWKLEVVVVPVSDVDRAKAFYVEKLGFILDVDQSAGEDFRIVHMTPLGSACSVVVMKNVERAGCLPGLQVVVADIDAARAELEGRGVEVSELFYFDDGVQKPGPEPQRASYNTFFSFSDPDGNSWLVQEVKPAVSAAEED